MSHEIKSERELILRQALAEALPSLKFPSRENLLNLHQDVQIDSFPTPAEAEDFINSVTEIQDLTLGGLNQLVRFYRWRDEIIKNAESLEPGDCWNNSRICAEYLYQQGRRHSLFYLTPTDYPGIAHLSCIEKRPFGRIREWHARPFNSYPEKGKKFEFHTHSMENDNEWFSFYRWLVIEDLVLNGFSLDSDSFHWGNVPNIEGADNIHRDLIFHLFPNFPPDIATELLLAKEIRQHL